MSAARGGIHKNNRKNAREQRLQFMNSQAALIAQKKREIEERLAQQQQAQGKDAVVDVREDAKPAFNKSDDGDQQVTTPAVLPFKNDGSFLEQFKLMQQQNKQQNQPEQIQHQQRLTELSYSPSVPNQQPLYYEPPPPPPPPPVDVSVPPPVNVCIPPPVTYYQQHPPPQYQIPPPTEIIVKEEIKRENRSPSPYSPSRPCEDEDEQAYIGQDYQQPGSSKSSEDSGNVSESGLDTKRKFKEEPNESEQNIAKERERKRQSRWGPQVKVEQSPIMNPAIPGSSGSLGQSTLLSRSTVLSRITTADPQILAYAFKVFGTTDLTEDQWKQCMDQVKMQYVYQEMLRKKQEREKLEEAGKVRYEYDSDEETEGGTWEHKRRMAEMEKTKIWAEKLTENGRGKHHLGDFLPPEELAKFMDKYQAVQEGRTIDESDYKEFKIAESNVGYQMLKKFGWTEGQGLGLGGAGITAPVNATRRNESQGLGIVKPEDLTSTDDEYDAYRKRMMLAYRFRPNPLNNPRRAYY